MEDKCSNCKEQQACIPFYVHENAMMHYNQANRRMLIVIVSVLIFIAIVITIFVNGNTIREKQLIDMVNQRIAEVENGVHEFTNPQSD